MDHNDSIFKMCLMTIESAAEMMKVSMGYVARLIKEGKVPFIVLEGEERIRMWDMMDYIEKNLKQYDEVLAEMRNIMSGEDDETE